ncbi:hypothetical protein CDD83_2100 [Cordyceps sp. RAO-2017]|nr:hypothetical protein CDD83_2100 [Cordyceps sp. RAO-2017]
MQAVLAAVLATLLLRGLVPSPVLDFLLDARWDALFEARDAARIALVQDTFACCGLDALDDRAYPFDAADTPCAALYRRHRPCKGPWMSAMQATSALDFAVVLTVGLMQILGLLLMRDRTGWWTALRTQGWKQAELGDDGSSQHLLPDPDNDDDGYGAVPHLKPAPAAAPERHADNR